MMGPVWIEECALLLYDPFRLELVLMILMLTMMENSEFMDSSRQMH